MRLLALVGLVLALSFATSAPGRADAPVRASVKTSVSEPFLLSIEGGFGLPLSAPQRRHFDPGGTIGVALQKPLLRWLAVGLRLRAAVFLDGDAPRAAGRADPGLGTLLTASAFARVRPLARANEARRGPGLFIELAAGGGMTGTLGRPAIEGGLGYLFGVGRAAVGPFVRYVQVLELSNELDSRDARLLFAGIEVTLFDRLALRPPPATPAPVAAKSEPAADGDADGVPDDRDGCPDVAEDRDGFQDDDGCPDPDDDGDGVPDDRDACPDAVEDHDGFEDEDGCPDPDNDGDGIADADDRCPNEGEVVNGVDDEDGCPDQGVIEMVGDRIVLEETVLFDFERARVRSSARPVIEAIVALVRQHPEWTRIRIEGHADTRGDEDFNRELSRRRAKNVLLELGDAGIPRAIMEFEGHGSSSPRDLEDTDEAHQRNRRVEFVVVSGGPPSIRKEPVVAAESSDEEVQR